ncbi:MAG: hypothetical protein IPM96_21155 [Ignavibacteria bacterium]|nr:hypothetical protein [Ignavibacteria bacterium]
MKKKIKILIAVFLISSISSVIFSAELYAQGAKSKQQNSRYQIEENGGSEDGTSEKNLEGQFIREAGKLKTKNHTSAKSQIYATIMMLIPDDTEPKSSIEWSKKDNINDVVWNTNNNYENEWGIELEGDPSSHELNNFGFSLHFYSHGIGGGDITIGEALELSFFLPDEIYESNILKERVLGGTDGYVMHELKFPGKQTIWSVVWYSSGSRQGDTGITFYIDKEEANKNISVF